MFLRSYRCQRTKAFGEKWLFNIYFGIFIILWSRGHRKVSGQILGFQLHADLCLPQEPRVLPLLFTDKAATLSIEFNGFWRYNLTSPIDFSQMALVVKNPPANVGDVRHQFDPWIGKSPWRRRWQPTSIILPGESHGQRGLLGYSPWGRTESDMSEAA